MDPTRAFLRHTVATLAYRGAKVLHDAPDGLATTRICDSSRDTLKIQVLNQAEKEAVLKCRV